MLRSTRFQALAILVLLMQGCGGGSPATVTGTQTPPATGWLELPILVQDAARNAFGVLPFGVHIADHLRDGHPGVDFEYLPATQIRAAAAGTVQSVFDDEHTPGRFTVQLQHTQAGRSYRTIYTNVVSVSPGLTAGSPVTAGQALGLPGTQQIFIGNIPVTFAMTHFQLDDMAASDGLTNLNAVSPESHFSPGARTALAGLWASAAYSQELSEPFLANPRGNLPFPTLLRSWVVQGPAPVLRLDIQHGTASPAGLTYLLTFASGGTEAGTLVLQSQAGTDSRLDFQPAAGGPPRLGLGDILDETLRMSLGNPGAPRPANLENAWTFKTTRP